MNLIANTVTIAVMVGLVRSVDVMAADGPASIVLDNSRINAQLYSYLGSYGVVPNDTEGGRWGGGAWSEPGFPGDSPGGVNTAPGSPIAVTVQITIQTLNLFLPVLTNICQSFGSCAGLVGPEAYLGRFWSLFLAPGANPISIFQTAVQDAINELRAYAASHGIGLVVGQGSGSLY